MSEKTGEEQELIIIPENVFVSWLNELEDIASAKGKYIFETEFMYKDIIENMQKKTYNLLDGLKGALEKSKRGEV